MGCQIAAIIDAVCAAVVDWDRSATEAGVTKASRQEILSAQQAVAARFKLWAKAPCTTSPPSLHPERRAVICRPFSQPMKCF